MTETTDSEDMSSQKLLEKAAVIEAAIKICRQLQCFKEAEKLQPVAGILKGAARIARGLEEEVETATIDSVPSNVTVCRRVTDAL